MAKRRKSKRVSKATIKHAHVIARAIIKKGGSRRVNPWAVGMASATGTMKRRKKRRKR